jgi:C_GCAxxG_C_C family probable redox protein
LLKQFKNRDPQSEELIAQIKKRAGNLYQTRQLLCTEAVLVTLNKVFNGGLSDAQAIAIAAPFGIGLGDGGCICGALSGAILASGLFVGGDQPYRKRQVMRKSARELHDEFKAAYGSTCCRVLSRNIRHDQQAHFQQCARLTEGAAEMAARLILDLKPELITSAEGSFLSRRDSGIGAMMKRLLRMVCLKI